VPGAEFDKSTISFRTMDVASLAEWEDLAEQVRDRFAASTDWPTWPG
jgi:hypothetical protein